MIKIELQAMGCRIAAFLDNEGQAAARALRQVPAWFEEWEQALSRFRPDSDLSRLNESAGMPVPVGHVLWEVVRHAIRIAHWSGGLVVPTTLNSLVRAGYDRSFDLLISGQPVEQLARQQRPDRQDPSGQQTGAAGPQPGAADWRSIVLDERSRSILLPPGVKLDLGGIGKGWSAWQAMLRLQAFGPALVNAGGDIAVSDVLSDSSPWPVDIIDPLQVQKQLDILALGSCGVATSGIDYRRWFKDGEWKHHIIDPRTGEPAKTDVMSVTVVAPDSLQAEAAAKAVLILGSEAGFDWLEERPQLAGLFALLDGRLLYSSKMDQYLWS